MFVRPSVEVLKIVPSNSRSQKLFRTSSSYVRFCASTAENGRRRCCNLQAPFAFFFVSAAFQSPRNLCRGPENCPFKLEVPKTIQDLEFLRSFPHNNCRKWTSSMLQSPSSLYFLFVFVAFQSPRNLQAPSAFFLYL